MIGWIRRTSQNIRHSKILKNQEWLWNVMRPIYRKTLNIFGKNGVPITLCNRSFKIHPKFAQTGYEKCEVNSYALIPKYLQAGHTFVDIGTAIGTYSLLASSIVGENGKVISYEADELVRNYLRKHIAWNKFEKTITIRDICCFSHTGEITFHISENNIGGEASILPLEGFKAKKIACTTLDDDLRKYDIKPNFIKIDVEGAEWDVLKGSVETLKKHKPLMLISLHPNLLEKQNITESNILDWLTNMNYNHDIVERDYETHVFCTPK